jgi:DNA-binding transcriptional ArsR family regulator
MPIDPARPQAVRADQAEVLRCDPDSVTSALWTDPLTGKQTLAYGVPVADVYKALADPTRRALLDELQERDEQTLFELCSRLATKHGLSPTRQAVGQHLDVLGEAGLVRRRREGRYTFHTYEPSPLRQVFDRWRLDDPQDPEEDLL